MISMILAACAPKPTPTPTTTGAPTITKAVETAVQQEATAEPTFTEEPTLEQPTVEEVPTGEATFEESSTDESPDLQATDDAFFANLPTDEYSDAQATEDLSYELVPTDQPGTTIPVIRTATKATSGTRTTPFAGIKTATPRTQGTRAPVATGFPTEETPTPGETPTVSYNPTPAGVPLGDPANPIIYGVVANPDTGDPTMLDSAQQLAAQLSQTTGFTIQVQTVNTTTELLNGMQLGAIHMAWMQPFTYILASRRQYAKVSLVTNHYGVYAYGAQFLANTDSGFTSYYNTTSNKTTGDAQTALEQLASKRPCYVDQLSASGYIAAAGSLAEQKVQTATPIFLLSHTAVVRALYVGGICDFGVTFSVYGDPRTSSSIQTDLPDVMSKVVVLWQTGEVIPNLSLAFQPNVPDNISSKISSALMDLVLGEDGRQLISSAAGYDVQDLKQIDDTFYDPLRQMVIASRVNLKTLIGK